MKQAQRASAGSDTVADVLDASAWRVLLAGLASAGLNGEAGLAMQAMVEAGVRVDKVQTVPPCERFCFCRSALVS